MSRLSIPGLIVIASLAGVRERAFAEGNQASVSKLAVKEVTVFKDGHAFVLHEGAVSLNAEGVARLDELPAPIMGTFWVASVDEGVRLRSVVAGKERMPVQRSAAELGDLIQANVGRTVVVTDTDGASFPATIADTTLMGHVMDRPRAPDVLNPRSAISPQPASTRDDDLVSFRLAGGVRVMPLKRIRELTFFEAPATTVVRDEDRNVLTLRFEPKADGKWTSGGAPASAVIGMGYVQRGLRWIPSYRLEALGDGKARLRLQATLINELIDLDGATVHLVIGVPTFRFKDTLDPMSMQQTLAQLSPYFRESTDARGTPNFLSNAIMSQTARMGEYAEQPDPQAGGSAGDVGPQGEGVEDLYVWSVDHVTLRKGERMVLPITEFALPCEDRYVLDVPISPLPEMRQQLRSQYEAELSRLLAAPKVMHHLRLTNTTTHPLTTAPILMIRDGRPLGQGMVTYTAPRATTDVEVTAAVGIGVSKSETEVERYPGAKVWRGSKFDRVSLEGSILLTNYRDQPVEVEVRRYVLGESDEVGEGGEARKQNVLELAPAASGGSGPYGWWHWYSWPWWWWNVNGVVELRWTVHLEPGKSEELNYKWHYFYEP